MNQCWKSKFVADTNLPRLQNGRTRTATLILSVAMLFFSAVSKVGFILALYHITPTTQHFFMILTTMGISPHTVLQILSLVTNTAS